MGKPKRSSVFALRARAYAFSELAACGGSQQEKKSFCEDTSRSGKGLPPSALLRSTRTHKPYRYRKSIAAQIFANAPSILTTFLSPSIITTKVAIIELQQRRKVE